MTDGNRKGAAFERQTGRMLSEWLTGGDDDSQLIRSVSSGGWSRRRVLQVGDLAPNGPRGEEFRRVFAVECKHRAEFEWRHVWTSGDPALVQWWRKHVGECEEAGLVPLLVYRKNYHPLLIGFPAGAIDLPDGPRVTVRWGDHEIEFVEWPVWEAADPNDVLEQGRACAESGGC